VIEISIRLAHVVFQPEGNKLFMIDRWKLCTSVEIWALEVVAFISQAMDLKAK
jgi:hypothetical protein